MKTPKKYSLDTALADIETARNSGFTAELCNGFDGTWECTFLADGDQMKCRGYGAGPRMEDAIYEALKNLHCFPSKKPITPARQTTAGASNRPSNQIL